MKLFVVFALCVASATCQLRSYGGAPQIRFRSLEPVVRETPYAPAAIRAEPLLVQEAPAYEQPAPVVRAEAYAPVEIRKVKEFVPIVKYSMSDDSYGTYNLETETADGSFVSETGSLKNGPEGAFNVKKGQYSYTVDGQTFTTNWIADENGYRAFGAHLPTSPPMPEEIQKSLELPRVAIADDYSYSAPAPAVRIEEPIVRVQQQYEAPVVRVQQQYQAPAPVVRIEEPIVRVQQQYEAPVVRVQQQYQAPAPVVRIEEPIVRVQQQYEAPVVRVQQQYEAPVVRVQQQYEAPVVRVQQQYEAPVVRVQQQYQAPAPVVRIEEPIVRQYAPAPVVRVAPTSYVIKSEGY